MDDLLIAIIKIVLDLFRKAQEGDRVAIEKLKEFLPGDLQTELVARIQDELDEKKFGRRIGER